jgi:hypothetical protein
LHRGASVRAGQRRHLTICREPAPADAPPSADRDELIAKAASVIVTGVAAAFVLVAILLGLSILRQVLG